MKDVTLNQREQARLQVLNSVMEYQLPRAQAAELLGISERQVRRILAAYRLNNRWHTARGFTRGTSPISPYSQDTALSRRCPPVGSYSGLLARIDPEPYPQLIHALGERKTPGHDPVYP